MFYAELLRQIIRVPHHCARGLLLEARRILHPGLARATAAIAQTQLRARAPVRALVPVLRVAEKATTSY